MYPHLALCTLNRDLALRDVVRGFVTSRPGWRASCHFFECGSACRSVLVSAPRGGIW